MAESTRLRSALLTGCSTDLGLLVRRGLGYTRADVRELQPGSYSAEHLEQACNGVDVVVHLDDPLPQREYHPIGAATPFVKLLEAAAGRVRRFVLHSSVQVYAPVPAPRWPILEHFPRLAHGAPSAQAYGQRKIDEEDALVHTAARGPMEFVVLRSTEVFGTDRGFAEQVLELVGLRPAAAVQRYSAIGVMQWVHVEDLADAILVAALDDTAAGQVFTIAGSESFTVTELAEAAWSRDPSPLRAERPAKFTSVKAAAVMGWSPDRPLSDVLVPREPRRRGGWRSITDAPSYPRPNGGRFSAGSVWHPMQVRGYADQRPGPYAHQMGIRPL
jgi:nucleoside-diphosphate-sugar epimerase